MIAWSNISALLTTMAQTMFHMRWKKSRRYFDCNLRIVILVIFHFYVDDRKLTCLFVKMGDRDDILGGIFLMLCDLAETENP